MKEKEFMEFLNTLANDVTEHFNKGTGNWFVRYYIVDGFHFFITIRYDHSRNVYIFEVTAISIVKVTRTHVIEGKYISSLFLRIPEVFFCVLREINSCD